MVVSSLQHGENYSLFIQFSPWRNPRLRHFVGYSFETSKKKHQPLPMAEPFKKAGINHFLWHNLSNRAVAVPERCEGGGKTLFLVVPQEAAESVFLEVPKR